MVEWAQGEVLFSEAIETILRMVLSMINCYNEKQECQAWFVKAHYEILRRSVKWMH